MELLISGLVIWSVVHLTPAVAPAVKARWLATMGEKGYKLSFTLLLLLALALIILGWRSTEPAFLYQVPAAARHPLMLLVLLAFILFGASKYPTRIKSIIRHPQLTGVLVWAVAHLLLNGDSRSVVLFGWMGTWALLEIILINRREGEWIKQPVPAWSREFRGLAISLVVFVVVVLIHPFIAGVPIR